MPQTTTNSLLLRFAIVSVVIGLLLVGCTQDHQVQATDWLAYSERGRKAYNAGDREQALRDYARAIEIAPYEPVLYVDRGQVLLELGRNKAAEADFNRAVELAAQTLAIALNERGALYLRTGDKQKANADLELAHQVDPAHKLGLPK